MQPPAREEITFTREGFYEKVWSVPTTKIATELGCSDVLIGKICKAYDIPKPYLGYWARREHGKKPKITPLPKNADPHLQSLAFYRYPGRKTATEPPKPEPVYDPDIQQMLAKARALEPVTVASSLHRPHPLVAATRDRIKLDRIPFHQRMHMDIREYAQGLPVNVSKETTSRALCIMDALIKRVEKIGGTVEIRKESWNERTTRPVVIFGGEEVSQIRLREKQNQVRIPPEKKTRPFGRNVELQPSGLLILYGRPSYLDSTLLRDTPKRRCIEDGLNDLIIGFVKRAGDMRIQRRLAEEARKQREELERIRRQQEEELRRRREELEKRQKAEQVRVDALVGEANAWRQSQIVRDYLDTICDVLLKRDGSVPINGQAADFLRWAHKQADRLDPLMTSPPSVLDERI
jgi:hypothetical protein